MNLPAAPPHSIKEADAQVPPHGSEGGVFDAAKVLVRSAIGDGLACPHDHTHVASPQSLAQKTWVRVAFYLHFCFALISLGALFWAASVLTRENLGNIPRIEPPSRLMAAIGSVGVDNTDGQWESFKHLAVPAIPFLLVYVTISRWMRKQGTLVFTPYLAVVCLCFAAFLHGPAFCFPLALVLVNYVFVALSVRFAVSYRVFMAVMWLSQLTLLFVVKCYGVYITLEFAPAPTSWWLERVRWTVIFNMYTLRMIAFNMDMYEAFNDGPAQQERVVRKHDTTCLECAQMREANHGESSPATRCYRFRTETCCHPREYNLLSYIAYMLYIPLYIAGPMSSFNAFASHCHHATVAVSRRQMIFYALRIFALSVILTFLVHFVHINALRYSSYLLIISGSFASFGMLYLQLGFLWLKFNCVWKLFRFVALLDGFDVPEDMRRCFSNTVSVQGFWRDWHASFNLWIVRYMYIPMGGNKMKYLNIFPIFFFIAVWHDVETHLFYWAFAVCMCLILELIFLQRVSRNPHIVVFQQRCPTLYLELRSACGAFSHASLMFACIVGFNVQLLESGFESSTPEILCRILFGSHLAFPFWFFAFAWSCSHVGLSYRDSESATQRREQLLHGLNMRQSVT